MRKLLPIMALLVAGPALAQKQGPADVPTEKINQVLVYGDQPCPPTKPDEIQVCVRFDDPYRLPKALRIDPKDPQSQAWANKVKSIEYVGRTGTQSCTPVGGGGFTGCFKQIVDKAYAEKAEADSTWANLVAAERAKRLAKIDAESEEIEARVKAEEAAKAAPPEPSR